MRTLLAVLLPKNNKEIFEKVAENVLKMA